MQYRSYVVVLAQPDRVASATVRSLPQVVSIAGACVSRALTDAMTDVSLSVLIPLEKDQVALILGENGLDVRRIGDLLRETQAQLYGECSVTFS